LIINWLTGLVSQKW